jgi:hypothetical protein
MSKPPLPPDPSGSGQDWPRTLDEAVGRLARTLSQAEKEEIAVLTEADLIGLHFGLGMRIRNEFGLWQDNRDLLMDCQRIKFKDSPAIPKDWFPEEWFEETPELSEKWLLIQPDDASGLIIRAIWARLRHYEILYRMV